MLYRVLLIVYLILYASVSMAGEKRYRIEILVITHIEHEAMPAEAESLRDFSASLDFLTPEDDDDPGDENEADDDEATHAKDIETELIILNELLVDESGDSEATPGLETDSELLPEEIDPWADVVAVEDLSDVMREAWRRLRLSAPFRPEQYLSWEQSVDEPFPSLRIHDLEVILIDDPCVDLREIDAIAANEDAEGEDKPVVFSDQGNILPGDSIEENPVVSAEEPEWPEPTLFYRIDGTVMLRRSRFLHLDLDLELRQAVFDDQALARTPILSSESETSEPELPVPSSFLIHTLKQSRQVKSQRMQYFDSPVLGVLAWITPFETEDEAESLSD